MRLYTKQHPFSYGRSAPQMAMKSEAVADLTAPRWKLRKKLKIRS